jgi:hypothetical protein
MDEQFTLEEFGKKIKTKYPQYANIPDADLANKIIAKHPQYKSRIKPNPPGAVSRFVEGVKHTTIDPLKDLWNIHSQNVAKHGPITGGLATLRDVAKGMYEAPHQYFNKAMESVSKGDVAGTIRNVEGSIPMIGPSLVEGSEAMDKGDYAGALGQATGLGIAMKAPSVAKGALSKVGELRTKVIPQMQRRAAQFVTRTGAEETTRPLVNKYVHRLEDVRENQAGINAETEKINQRVKESASAKNAEKQVDYQKKITEQEAQRQKDIAEFKKEKTAVQKKSGGIIQERLQTGKEASRREGIETSIERGSQELVKRVEELLPKVRQEANAKYAPVREAVSKDPGVSAKPLVDKLNEVKQNILRTDENVNEFREIGSMQSDADSVAGKIADSMDYSQEQMSDPKMQNIVNFLEQQGVSGDYQPVTFDQLQGWKSRIDAAISKGPQPGRGDVYKALQEMKGVVEKEMSGIAEKNGVKPQFDEAQAFWGAYQRLFWDRDSAVADIHRNIKSRVNPELAAKPLVEGKTSQSAIADLKRFGSQYSDEAGSIADLALNMQKGAKEASGLPKQATEGKLPTMPKEPQSPKPIKQPKEVKPKIKEPRQVREPKPVTTKDIIDLREERVISKSSELGGGRRFDIMKILSHPVSGTVEVVAEKIAAAGLRRPEIANYLKRFTEADLKFVEKLPEPQRTALRNNIIALMKEQSNGKNPIAPNPYLQKALGVSGLMAVSKKQPVQNRKEALERLNTVNPQSSNEQVDRKRTKLNDINELEFQVWYRGWAKRAGIDPNPDDPLHKYDYRGAWKAGYQPEINQEDGLYHWPSEFKDDDHPNRFVKGVDTKNEK